MIIVIAVLCVVGIVLLGELLDKVGFFDWLNVRYIERCIDKWGE